MAISVAADGVVAIVPAVTDKLAIVPRLVNDEPVTPDANVAPVNVPAGAITAAVVMLVVKPLALIVTTGIAVLDPVTPAVATVANVVALPTEVTSPVKLALVVTFPAVKPDAVPVMFVPTKADGVPSAGVTRVGELAKTFAPVPVSSVNAAARFADVKLPRDVAFPTEVIAPVKLAFVVTLPAVKPEAVPVILVPIKAEGVPSAGVTSVGELANTAEPVPVSSVKAVARFADVKLPSEVAFPTDVTAPVKLAFVVTLPAVNPAAVPVTLVIIPEAGVPNAGEVMTGLVNVLFVNVSVVSLPTNVVFASGNVITRPAVATASSKVTALAALPELRKRMPLLKSVPSLIVTSPVPFGCMCKPVFALAPSA